MVTLSNSDDQIYFDIPILNHINAKEFLTALIGVNNAEKTSVAYALRERYKYEGIALKLIDEIAFLKSLESEISTEVEKRTGKVSGYTLQLIRDVYLRGAISQLEKLRKPPSDPL